MMRPRCIGCGRPYGHREINCQLLDADPETGSWPPYRGNLQVVREDRWSRGQTRGARYLWDGETYITPYEPFCTLRCALSFARAAVDAGYRLTTKDRAA